MAAGILTGDRVRAEGALGSGAAHEVFDRWVAAQGGHPDAPLDAAPVVVEAPAPRATTVRRCHAYRIGELAMELGAGRRVKGAGIDHAVGVVVHHKSGDQVEAGEPLATVHAREPVDPALASRRLLQLQRTMPSCPRSRPSAAGWYLCCPATSSPPSRSATAG